MTSTLINFVKAKSHTVCSEFTDFLGGKKDKSKQHTKVEVSKMKEKGNLINKILTNGFL